MLYRELGWICVALLAVAALAGCASEATPAGAAASATPAEAAIAFPGATVLAQGSQLQYEDPNPRFLIIDDEQAWADFWKTYAPDGQTASPPVDFRSSIVLVGIQGAKSSGGYSIHFRELEAKGDAVHVVTELTEPTADQPAETTFTQPYTIVQVDADRLPDQARQTFVFETPDGEELSQVVQTVGENRDLEPVGSRPTNAPAPGVGTVPFPGATVLAQGLQLAYDNPSPRFLVVTGEDGWTEFWQTYAPEGQRAAPPVDWGTAFVLAGIQGNKSTGGYSIAFAGLEQVGDEVRVTTRLTQPEAGGIAEPAFTQPYTIVQVELARLASRGELSFVFETEGGEELGRVTHAIPD
jgi:hypothetical protein